MASSERRGLCGCLYDIAIVCWYVTRLVWMVFDRRALIGDERVRMFFSCTMKALKKALPGVGGGDSGLLFVMFRACPGIAVFLCMNGVGRVWRCCADLWPDQGLFGFRRSVFALAAVKSGEICAGSDRFGR